MGSRGVAAGESRVLTLITTVTVGSGEK